MGISTMLISLVPFFIVALVEPAATELTDLPYWPTNATIPYVIQPGFTATQMVLITRFFSDVNAKTCVRFVPRENNEVSYMNFIKGSSGSDGCWADLGNVGQTRVVFEDSCFEDGYWQISHNIMHGLGMRHEHIRPDRDDFVQVLTNNIDPTKVGEFTQRSSGNQAVLNIAYDLKSVMHFFKDQYSSDGYSNTLQKIGDPNYGLSNRDGPTALDYQKIAAIYCNGVTKMPNTPRPPTVPTTTTPKMDTSAPCTSTTDITGNTSGTISNAQVNGYYRPNENCGWMVAVDSNKVISMRFTMLDIEYSEGCVTDVVTIYDGDNWDMSPIIANLCGRNLPLESYTTTDNKMLVIFSTDAKIQARGFTLTYSAVDPIPYY